MKLQLTSAKVIKSLADSDCKYCYLEDSLVHEHVNVHYTGPEKRGTRKCNALITSFPTLHGVN